MDSGYFIYLGLHFFPDLGLCGSNLDCSHLCQNTPDGMMCYCPQSLHLQLDGVTCSADHPCETWGICAHKCEAIKSKYKCGCNPGYILQSDGFSCKSSGMSLFIKINVCFLISM